MTSPTLRLPVFCLLASCLALMASPADARRQGFRDWQARYGASSSSGDNAGCQLCHVDSERDGPREFRCEGVPLEN